MSKTVDERVVSMQFDNKNFESNVQTSLSTLDKLKQSLNLTGASKGLENVSAAAKNVDMSTLGGAVETVRMKFSALEVMGVTALANITNSAVNAGKRIVSALTIEPVKTGFNEYELKMDSIKTIMASTGESVETVNKYLDELNEYSDQTIYSFADMTQNIGKFTNAGVKLEDAVLAIKGISNEAAVSGANANEASRAMYNFAQALSAGYVKLIDWKSIENANMATVEFKQQLIDTAVEIGTVTKSADGMYATLEGNAFNATKNFNEVLQDQWMTTDVLVKTLGKYSDSTTEIGKKAYAAAQDVTKLSQMFDVLKETAQSGWAKTWELIFGDIEKAKALFTPLTTFLSKVIDSISDFRNNLLEGALSNSPWKSISEKLGTIKKVADSITNVTDKLETFQSVVSKVWRGDYGNMWPRWNALDEEGYNSDVIQDLVNLGYEHEITMEDVEASYKKYGLTLDNTAKSTEKMTSSIENLSDAQLKEAGLTDEEIKLYRELQEEAKRTNTPINELIESLSETDGRTLLIDSLKNAGSGLVGVFTALKNAWVEIFPPMTSIQLLNLIKGLNEFSEKLRLTDKETGELTDTAKKLQRTFKGIFAALDIVLTIVGGPLKIAFKILKQILSMFHLDILDVTAGIGDAIVGFRDWIDSLIDIEKIFNTISPIIKDAADAIGKWFDGLTKTDNIPKYIWDSIVNGFNKATEAIKTWFEELKKSDTIVGDILRGFENGLVEGIKVVMQTIIDFAKGIIDKVKEILGIHSPSTVFAIIGIFVMLGLANGLEEGFNSVRNTLKSIFSRFVDTIKNVDFSAYGSSITDSLKEIITKCVDFIKNVDLGTLLAAGLGIGAIFVLNKIGNAVSALTSPFEGATNVLNAFSKTLKSLSFSIKVEAIKNLAIAIALLVASIFVLTKLDADKVWVAIGQLVLLAGTIVGLTILLGRVGKASAKDFAAFSLMVVSLSVSFLIMAAAIKVLESVEPERAMQAFAAITGMIIGIGVLMVLMGTIFRTKAEKTINDAGKMILKIAISMLLMAFVIKTLSKLDVEACKQGFACLAIFALIISELIIVTSLAGKNSGGVGKALLGISVSILLLCLAVKMLGGLSESEISNGLKVIVSFALIISGLIAVTLLAGKNAGAIGKAILGISAGILLLCLAVKMLSGISEDDLNNGIKVISTFALIIAGLIVVTNLAGTNLKKVGSTLLMMSLTIGILAGIAILLGLVDPEKLKRGVIAVSILGVLVAVMVASTGLAKDCKANLIAMAVTIALFAGIVIAMSFMDPAKIYPAVAALTVILGMFSLLVASSRNATGSAKTILAITLAIAALGACVYALSSLPINSVMSSAMALSVLIIALSSAFVILGKAKRTSSDSLIALSVMAILMAGLTFMLAMLASMPVENTLGSAVALSVLLLALTSAVYIIGNAKGISVKSLITLTVMTAIMVGLSFMLSILASMPVENTLGSALALSTVLLAMAAVCAILSLMSVNVVSATNAALGLSAFVVILGALLAALGGLSSIPGFNDIISSGGETLAMIGYAIGNFVGSIIGGFGEGVTSGLPAIADNLSAFIEHLTPFITGVSSITPESLQGVSSLVSMILMLTAANFLESITSFLTGESSLESFASELVAFGKAMVNFSEVVSGNIDQEAVQAAADAGAIMAAFQNSLPNTGGVFQFFTGEKDMVEFGNQLVPFGRAIVRFSKVVSEGDINKEAIQAASDAGGIMVAFQKTLPDTGGVVQWFTGEKDMVAFGNQLVPFGRAIVRFSKVVSEGDINQEAIQAASDAGAIMVEFQKTLPDTGGVVQFFTGDKDMVEFGNQLVPFGRAIVRFSKLVSKEGCINKESIQAASDAGGIMVAFQKTLPDTGGIVQWFTGDKDMVEFGNQLVPFGRAITRFSRLVDGKVNTTAVTAAKSAGDIMLELYNSLPNTGSIFDIFNGTKDLSAFSEQLVNYGNGIVKFSDVISGGVDSEAVTSAAVAGLKIVEILNTFPDSVDFDNITNGLTSFGDSMVEFSDIVCGNIDTYTITAVADVGKTLAETASIMPNQIDFANLTEGLTTFGGGIVSFSKSVSDGLNIEAIESASTVGKSIAEMVSAIPENIDMVNFSSGVSTLGESIKSFASSGSEVSSEDVEKAISAGTKIGDMLTEHVPDYVDIEDYANNMSRLGASISNFSKYVSGDNAIDKEAIEAAVDAGTKIGDMLKDHVPQYVDIEDYATYISKLGASISNFSKYVSGDNAIDKEAVDNAIDAGTKIGDMLINHVPQYVDIADYTTHISQLGASIANFSKYVSGDNAIDKEAVDNAISAGTKIGDMLINHVPQYVDIADYIGNITKLGKSLSSFSKSVSGDNALNKEAIDNAISAGKNIGNMLKNNIPQYVNVSEFVDTLPKVASAIKDFSDEIDDLSSEDLLNTITAFKKIMNSLEGIANTGISKFTDPFKNSKTKVKKAISTMADYAVDALDKNSNHDKFKSVGKYLVEGFADGISDNTFMAEAKAKAMAEAAEKAAKDALDINSPSKVFRKIGGSVPEGFAQGIDRLSNLASESTEEMARDSVNSALSSVSYIADVINSDIDAEPTIRPVLDLTNVRSGANAIGGMLSGRRTLSISTDSIGSISASMSRRQNGNGSSEIVSAIRALRDDIANTPRNTYNVNGITYDDGSNITTAVKDLVRAARIERRI